MRLSAIHSFTLSLFFTTSIFASDDLNDPTATLKLSSPFSPEDIQIKPHLGVFDSCAVTGLPIVGRAGFDAVLYTDAITDMNYASGYATFTPVATVTSVTNPAISFTTGTNQTPNIYGYPLDVSNGFTVVLTGYLLAPQLGLYPLSLTGINGGAVIWIGNGEAFDCCANNYIPETSDSTYILSHRLLIDPIASVASLVAGRYYPFRMVYSNTYENSNLDFVLGLPDLTPVRDFSNYVITITRLNGVNCISDEDEESSSSSSKTPSSETSRSETSTLPTSGLTSSSETPSSTTSSSKISSSETSTLPTSSTSSSETSSSETSSSNTSSSKTSSSETSSSETSSSTTSSSETSSSETSSSEIYISKTSSFTTSSSETSSEASSSEASTLPPTSLKPSTTSSTSTSNTTFTSTVSSSRSSKISTTKSRNGASSGFVLSNNYFYFIELLIFEMAMI
ncbi:Tda8 protein [Pichia kluyveri]|uniref:Tda8 protein n=1 Tax=Pichia kluyveri TaxID=36015 RepID=A0AAV5R3U8_PICKL|nr:Tda8 protein [Pichia kluyveri]